MESPARCRYAYYYAGDVLGHAQNGGNDLDKINAALARMGFLGLASKLRKRLKQPRRKTTKGTIDECSTSE